MESSPRSNQIPQLVPMDLPALSKPPLVSVLIPNYNYELFLGEALESLLAQTYANWEAIVCDDGSSDGSRELIQKYAARDPRFRYIFQQNSGVAAALNSCFSQAHGEIIAILDSDDIFLPAKLESVVNAFHNRPKAGMCIHRLQDFNGVEKTGVPTPAKIADGWIAPKAMLEGGYDHRIPTASGLSFRRQVLAAAFPLPRDLRRLLDYYLAGICIMLTEVAGLPAALTLYRLHGNNLTGSVQGGSASIDRLLSDCDAALKVRCDYLRGLFGSWPAMQLEQNPTARICALKYYFIEGKMPSAFPLSPARLLRMEPSWVMRMAWGGVFLLPSGSGKILADPIRRMNLWCKRKLATGER